MYVFLSKVLEDYLRKEYELPTWGIFCLIAAVTVVAGLLVGGVSCMGDNCKGVCHLNCCQQLRTVGILRDNFHCDMNKPVYIQCFVCW